MLFFGFSVFMSEPPEMKRYRVLAAWLISTLVSLVQGPVNAQEISVDAIAAIVGSEAITFAELERRLDQRIAILAKDAFDQALIEQERPRLRRDMLKIIIQEKLLLQEAERLKIEVTEPEIDRELNRRIESQRERGVNISDVEGLYQLALERDNMTRQEVRDQVRRDMLTNKLLWGHVWPSPGLISPGRIKSYYREHRADFQTPSKLRFRMITVEPDDESEFHLAAIDSALDDGRPFEEIEARFSDNPIVWNRKLDELTAWPNSLLDALEKMKAGETRRRVRSPRGWHYLHMVELDEGDRLPFSEVQERIQRIIRETERRRQHDAYTAKLRKRYYIDNLLARRDQEAGKGKADSDAEAEKDEEDEQASGKTKTAGEGVTEEKKIRRLTPDDQ